jgi:hypothetical protein
VRGLSIKMPAVEVALPDNRTFVGDWLFLEVAPDQLLSPAYSGKTVAFTGCFRAHGVFPNLKFLPDDEQQKVFLGLLLENGRVLASQ